MGFLDKTKDMLANKTALPVVSVPDDVKNFDKETYVRATGKKEVYYSKESISRPSKSKSTKRANRVFLTIGAVVVLLLLVMQQFSLIFVIAGLIFINQVLTQAPPQNVKYEISNYGILYADKQYYWPEIRHFFFSTVSGMEAVIFETFEPLPGRIYIFIDKDEKAKLDDVLANHLPKLDSEPQTFLDKAYKKISDTFEF